MALYYENLRRHSSVETDFWGRAGMNGINEEPKAKPTRLPREKKLKGETCGVVLHGLQISSPQCEAFSPPCLYLDKDW